MPAFDPNAKKMLISGNEAISLSMRHCNVQFAAGYPGTPSTEILEDYSELGGYAQWAPNEKVAAEVALGAAFGHARSVVTMKMVGLNVASDVLYTATYTGVDGGMVWIVADDPGQGSSQNEQDSNPPHDDPRGPLQVHRRPEGRAPGHGAELRAQYRPARDGARLL